MSSLKSLLFDHNWMYINPSNAELNPICHLLALLGAHRIRHVSRLRVKRGGVAACRVVCIGLYLKSA